MRRCLGAPDTTGELHIRRQNCHTASMNGTQIRVLRETSAWQHDVWQTWQTITSNSLKTNDSPASCRASIAWALKLRLACENTSQRAASVLQSDASCLKVLRHLTNHPAIRRLGNEELRRLLVPPDLPQGARARSPPAGFLEPTQCESTLANRLDGKNPRLTASGPARSLLGPAYAPALV